MLALFDFGGIGEVDLRAPMRESPSTGIPHVGLQHVLNHFGEPFELEGVGLQLIGECVGWAYFEPSLLVVSKL